MTDNSVDLDMTIIGETAEKESALADRLSVVVPFYNEQACIVPVVEELAGTLTTAMTIPWEVILVDDGSSDATPRLMDELAERHTGVIAVHIPPNSGQSAAMEAGFSLCRGDLVAVMDGDDQNDPRDIPRLLAALTSRRSIWCAVSGKTGKTARSGS